ncbi:MAG: hypothetical protein FJ009_03025 [Chloroflexi bacterium]|nr:hypothetical protein [Chloroflexota bacterium]
MDLLDLPAYFDPINRIEGMISTFRNADWHNAYAQRGVAGLVDEFFACVFSSNAPTIRVARGSPWRGIDIERLLARHGVKVWDRGIAGDDLYFCVKRRQLKWAEYLLLRAGVPVTSALSEPRNAHWAEKYPPGSEPPTRRATPGSFSDWIDQLLAFLR